MRAEGELAEKVGARLHKAVKTLREAIEVITKRGSKKRAAIVAAGGPEGEVSAALAASLEAERDEVEDTLHDKPYLGFIEIWRTDEEIARDEAGETGNTGNTATSAAADDGEPADLREFSARNLSRRLYTDLGEAGMRAVDAYVRLQKEIREVQASHAEPMYGRDVTDPSKLEQDVVSHLPCIVEELATDQESAPVGSGAGLFCCVRWTSCGRKLSCWKKCCMMSVHLRVLINGMRGGINPCRY